MEKEIRNNQEPLSNLRQVHTTTFYPLFKPIDGNRTLNTLHLNRLRNAMVDNYLFTVIIVNERYEIIDGQHRFECIKELGYPLHYIICKGYGLDEVHILNQNSKDWHWLCKIVQILINIFYLLKKSITINDVTK